MGTSVGEKPEPTRREDAEGPGSARGLGLGTAPSRGLKALSLRHRDAYANGTMTQGDIALELAVTKQAVQKAFQQRGWSKTGTPPGGQGSTAPTEPSSRAPQPAPAGSSTQPAAAPTQQSAKDPSSPADGDDDDWLTAEQRRQYNILIARGSLKAIVQTIREVNDSMAKNAGRIGPSAMNGYMRAMRSALEMGSALLYRPDDDAGMLSGIHVLTMTDEDVALVKAEASERCKAPDQDEPMPASSSVQAKNSDEKTPRAVPSPIDGRTLLPGRTELRNWLLSRAKSHGRRHLRDIAEHVGLRPALQDTDGYLVDSIVHAIDGDPQRLRRPSS